MKPIVDSDPARILRANDAGERGRVAMHKTRLAMEGAAT
jgi:hypothetical protein